MRCHRLVLVCCSALFAATAAPAQDKPAGAACAEDGATSPEQVIEACGALLMDKATPEARLPAIFLSRAQAFVRQGRPRLAIEDLGRVVEQRPDNASAFLKRAELNRGIGDNDAAIRDLSSAIRLEPGNAGALFTRAELYRARSDRRRAFADYAAVLRLDPSHEAAAANRKALAQEIEQEGALMPLQR